MSSSELSNDGYDYETYCIVSDEEDNGPLLISKRARLLAAAAQNDVETMKQLLDSPKWYKVRNKYGRNLLHIAILRENDEVFDYLLSLDDFPLEAVDGKGATALVVALSSYFVSISDHIRKRARYASELIKKGADIDKISPEGQPLLHCALQRGCVEVARLLVERGADVNMPNQKGDTPLHMCFYSSGNDLTLIETITMLLCYGADASICDHRGRTVLDSMIWRSGDTLVALENVFFSFTIDEWSSLKIHSETLLQLAQNKSPLFHQVIKFTSEIICEGRLDLYCFYLFTMDSEYLGILLEKYPSFIKELLQSYSGIPYFQFTPEVELKNFDVLMQSSLDSDLMEFISKINSSRVISYILSSRKNIDEIMGLIYYLLSYGMTLHEIDLEKIYRKSGYSEDFKNLLVMDVEKQMGQKITEMMPRLIYDVTLDIHKTVEDPFLCKFKINWKQIFNYFVHPKIQNAYYQIKSNEVIGRQLPQVPLLQELARDTFRRYFVKRLKITTSKQFYSLIKRLRISSVHEKILTFESKLY